MCNNKSVEDQISSEPKTISKIFVQQLGLRASKSKLSVILQEESPSIGLLSIQIEKYKMYHSIVPGGGISIADSEPPSPSI